MQVAVELREQLNTKNRLDTGAQCRGNDTHLSRCNNEIEQTTVNMKGKSLKIAKMKLFLYLYCFYLSAEPDLMKSLYVVKFLLKEELGR